MSGPAHHQAHFLEAVQSLLIILVLVLFIVAFTVQPFRIPVAIDGTDAQGGRFSAGEQAGVRSARRCLTRCCRHRL